MLDRDPSRSVAEDLERVFQGIDSSRSRGNVVPAGPDRAKSTSAGTRERWFTAAAPVLVGTLAIALALHAGSAAPPAPHRQSAASAPPPLAAKTGVDRSPEVAAAQHAAASVGPAAPAEESGGHRRHADGDRDGSRPKLASSASSGRRHPTVRPGAARAGVEETSPREGCRPHSDADECIYEDVLQADRRLRVAYRMASDAGAPQRYIAAVSRRWREARSISLQEPDEAIRRYDELTRELGGFLSEDARW